MGWRQPSDCGSQSKARWRLTQAFRRLGAAFTVARLHAAATRSLQWKHCQQRLVSSTNYQVSQIAFAFFDVNDTLDATARPTDRAEKGNNRVRTALANAFKVESGVMTVLQRTGGISSEYTAWGSKSATG